ncbi:MAG: hypothetical protein SCH98_12380 [Deferrisomatales bacterium]|nr:hypothetical protein [Deferrisomatales bacterium]
MSEIRLRSIHRWLGVVLLPFLFLQTLSGVLLSVGLYRRMRRALVEAVPGPVEEPVATVYDTLLAAMHYGSGPAGYIYHVALGLGMFLLLGSGGWIWVRRLSR